MDMRIDMCIDECMNMCVDMHNVVDNAVWLYTNISMPVYAHDLHVYVCACTHAHIYVILDDFLVGG